MNYVCVHSSADLTIKEDHVIVSNLSKELFGKKKLSFKEKKEKKFSDKCNFKINQLELNNISKKSIDYDLDINEQDRKSSDNIFDSYNFDSENNISLNINKVKNIFLEKNFDSSAIEDILKSIENLDQSSKTIIMESIIVFFQNREEKLNSDIQNIKKFIECFTEFKHPKHMNKGEITELIDKIKIIIPSKTFNFYIIGNIINQIRNSNQQTKITIMRLIETLFRQRKIKKKTENNINKLYELIEILNANSSKNKYIEKILVNLLNTKEKLHQCNVNVLSSMFSQIELMPCNNNIFPNLIDLITRKRDSDIDKSSTLGDFFEDLYNFINKISFFSLDCSEDSFNKLIELFFHMFKKKKTPTDCKDLEYLLECFKHIKINSFQFDKDLQNMFDVITKQPSINKGDFNNLKNFLFFNFLRCCIDSSEREFTLDNKINTMNELQKIIEEAKEKEIYKIVFLSLNSLISTKEISYNEKIEKYQEYNNNARNEIFKKMQFYINKEIEIRNKRENAYTKKQYGGQP